MMNVQAQLLLDTTKSGRELVNYLLDADNSDLIIKNVSFKGNRKSVCAFKTIEKTHLMDEGILMSTGHVHDALGPNDSPKTGVRSNSATDQDLQALATGVVLDAVVLEFDLLALKDSLEFTYVFASEEYPEYVDKGVNDLFAFFIKEIGGKAIRPRNIARLPDGKTVVNIDNVNHRLNENYFLRSDFPDAHDHDFWAANKDMFRRAQYFEFDGFTVPLKATLRLSPGKWYHLKMVIADVGDRFYDSAVLIKANSLKSNGQRIEQADSIVKDYIRSEVSNSYAISTDNKGNLSFSLKLHFNTNKSEILPESHKDLRELIALLSSFQDLKVEIVGHTDNVGTETDNLSLSKRRAQSVFDYLSERQINQTRLTTNGLGETKPIADNFTEEGRQKNRRVEFILSY